MAQTEMDPTPTHVRVIHLADNSGKVQAIFGQDSVLDLTTLSRLTKRRLTPWSRLPIEGDTLLDANKTPTFIDKALLKEESVSFHSKSDLSLKAMSGQQLAEKLEGKLSYIENITYAGEALHYPAAGMNEDEKQMQTALGRFQSIRLKQRLEETLEIPPLSNSSTHIIQLSADPNASSEQLCQIVNLDPSLSAQVISWASSPYYGGSDPVESIEDAIIRVLGFDMVMNLSLGLSMGGVFELPKDGPKHYDDFWFSAVSHAALMESLVKSISSDHPKPRLGHAYLAGLLHNFGYLAISVILPPHFSILSRNLEANAHLPSNVVEMQVLHFTKEQLGAWLLKHWNIPADIYGAVRYCKDEGYQGEHKLLANLLYVANRLLDQLPISEHLLDQLGLNEETALQCRQQVLSASKDLRDMVNLIHGKT
ncbi:HDOD domain-containing protein [Marinomonas mediterranea]|jgi:Predicted signal transduction protein|uniref:Putative signal transduction protein n=1 Tax=Marinomonas mediterranea (strain ATCC 700492 / JCM 21426 / NBRC 103028 / MMB-1) TaxID=717774 RepID=F2K0Z0_MARM1|nr:HDOD domain-containing protein [Marinomonas mediterranea]ADZ93339.1 putative signal transduction protein [Marinomonas mediterranea MMB-1]WCN11228.1 HDOD domain-containing protein [Marinomonas mediterranea]WCN19335.1 HDOD domain-containing protein [Marinomonas mediterranea MMB-1]